MADKGGAPVSDEKRTSTIQIKVVQAKNLVSSTNDDLWHFSKICPIYVCLSYCSIVVFMKLIIHWSLIHVNYTHISYHSEVLKAILSPPTLEWNLEKLSERQIKRKLAQMELQNSILMPV